MNFGEYAREKVDVDLTLASRLLLGNPQARKSFKRN